MDQWDWNRRFIIGGLTILILSTVGCGLSPPSSVPIDTGEHEEPYIQYSGVLAASEFLVGNARFPFGLINIDGDELRKATVNVSFYSMSEPEPQLRDVVTAEWREITGATPHDHEDGTIHEHSNTRGLYVVDEAKLSEPGFWTAEFSVTTDVGATPDVEGVAFQVIADSHTPLIGEIAPRTNNLTIYDVQKFSDLSTRLIEDDMHQYSVAQALELGVPFVVLFSSPMFCSSKMCGPVTDMAATVHERYLGDINFIHIEPWDISTARNQGLLSRSTEMQEWGLVTEPWLFVVGDDGRITARFEGLVTGRELERELDRLLETA